MHKTILDHSNNSSNYNPSLAALGPYRLLSIIIYTKCILHLQLLHFIDIITYHKAYKDFRIYSEI